MSRCVCTNFNGVSDVQVPPLAPLDSFLKRVSVCVREKRRERERDRQTQRKGGRYWFCCRPWPVQPVEYCGSVHVCHGDL